MLFSTQVLAECKTIEPRFLYILHRIEALVHDFVPFGGGIEMIVELETDIVRLENILGDTDQKEQDHLL